MQRTHAFQLRHGRNDKWYVTDMFKDGSQIVGRNPDKVGHKYSARWVSSSGRARTWTGIWSPWMAQFTDSHLNLWGIDWAKHFKTDGLRCYWLRRTLLIYTWLLEKLSGLFWGSLSFFFVCVCASSERHQRNHHKTGDNCSFWETHFSW